MTDSADMAIHLALQVRLLEADNTVLVERQIAWHEVHPPNPIVFADRLWTPAGVVVGPGGAVEVYRESRRGFWLQDRQADLPNVRAWAEDEQAKRVECEEARVGLRSQLEIAARRGAELNALLANMTGVTPLL